MALSGVGAPPFFGAGPLAETHSSARGGAVEISLPNLDFGPVPVLW
jgi:hypothetical protein